MKYVFAGDRQISVNILNWMINMGYRPSALMVSSGDKESHAEELFRISKLARNRVFISKSYAESSSIELLRSLNVDYFICIHFPYIIPSEVLKIPKIGFLNLHPAYLPFNKGWHTPSWAILDGTPYGATLHFMTEALDEGNIIHQKIIDVKPNDTADSLYKRVLALEEVVFKEAFNDLLSLSPKRNPQKSKGTAHEKRDLESIQLLREDEVIVVNKLRALTTNMVGESAFFYRNGKKYHVHVKIIESN